MRVFKCIVCGITSDQSTSRDISQNAITRGLFVCGLIEDGCLSHFAAEKLAKSTIGKYCSEHVSQSVLALRFKLDEANGFADINQIFSSITLESLLNVQQVNNFIKRNEKYMEKQKIKLEKEIAEKSLSFSSSTFHFCPISSNALRPPETDVVIGARKRKQDLTNVEKQPVYALSPHGTKRQELFCSPSKRKAELVTAEIREERPCEKESCKCCEYWAAKTSPLAQTKVPPPVDSESGITDQPSSFATEQETVTEYEPSDYTSSQGTLSNGQSSQPTSSPDVLKKYFLVDGQRLIDLCSSCPKCGWFPDKGAPVPVRLRAVGSAPILMFKCPHCATKSVPETRWEGQSRTIPGSGDRTFAGNTAIVTASITTGLRYTALKRWCDQLQLATISKATYYRLYKTVLKAVERVYNRRQELILERVKREYELIGKEQWEVSADGAYDCRGFCATIGKVVIADQQTGLIVQIETLHNSETGQKSSRMELLGLERGIENLFHRGISVSTITTDRCRAFGKKIAEINEKLGTNTEHEFDAWHIGKSVGNKIKEESKYAQCGVLYEWMDSVKTHLWSAIEAGRQMNNREHIRWIFNSSIYHAAGIHKWKKNPELTGPYTQCNHGPLGPRDHDLVFGSKAHEKLRKVIEQPRLQEDIIKGNVRGTSKNESKNALDRVYAPKEIFIPFATYHPHAMMSTLHINELTLAELDGRRKVEAVYTVQKKFLRKTSKVYRKTQIEHTWRHEIHEETLLLIGTSLREKGKAKASCLLPPDPDPYDEMDLDEDDLVELEIDSDDDMGTEVEHRINRHLQRVGNIHSELEIEPEDDPQYSEDNHTLRFAYNVRNGYYEPGEYDQYLSDVLERESAYDVN